MKRKTKKNLTRKPMQQRGREKVAEVLSATETLIQKHGCAGFTMSDVANESNISIASIYQYFPNKRAILESLVSNHLQALREHVYLKLENKPESVDELWRATLKLFDEGFEFHRTNPVVKDVLIGSAGDKALVEIMKKDTELHHELYFQMFKHLFKTRKHPQLRQALVLIIEFGKQGLLGAVELEEEAAKDRVKMTKKLLSDCWKNTIKPMEK